MAAGRVDPISAINPTKTDWIIKVHGRVDPISAINPTKTD
ncbi:uncharacterized protein G2W53_033734 [Senna tora]|uniref:Uncharacterized protein n=1 Tax=Senna tora TaxID=362788 RepID=A0A834SZT7_9FABA|nr:uncharacterized protein G2W53_033734 [Senna tora]